MAVDLKPGAVGEGFEGRALGAVHEWDDRNDLFTMDRYLDYSRWEGSEDGANMSLASPEKRYEIGPIRDQGSTPQCVGYGHRAILDAGPIINRPDGKFTPTYIWKESQKIDEFPGERNDQGTSNLAACKVLVREGMYKAYTWARRDQAYSDVINWLDQFGPVAVALPWYKENNTPDYMGKRGFLQPFGNVVGSHLMAIVGYSKWGTLLVQGSWGDKWGDEGMVYITEADFMRFAKHPWFSCSAPTEIARNNNPAPPKPKPKPSIPDPTDDVLWSPNRTKGAGGDKQTGVTEHYEAGYHSPSVAWLRNPASQASAHWAIRGDGYTVQLVPEQDDAWHAKGSGMSYFGIEHEGFGNPPPRGQKCMWKTAEHADKLRDDDLMLIRSANLNAYLIAKYPKIKANYERVKHDFTRPYRRDTDSTLAGHIQMAGNDHTDPHPGFPWKAFINAVDDFLAGRRTPHKGRFA